MFKGEWVIYRFFYFVGSLISRSSFLSSLPTVKSQYSRFLRDHCLFSLSPVSIVVSQTSLGLGRALLTLALLPMALSILPPASVHGAGEPGEFLQWGAGARSLAMGRAFLAVSDDASATYWNPAAMVQMKQKQFMALQASLFEQTTYNFMSYVHPTSKAGAWGFNLTRLNSGGFEKVEVKSQGGNAISIEQVGTYNVAQQAFTFAYGKQVTNKLAMGISLKRITNTIDTFSQAFSAVDTSVFTRVSKNYRFALGIRNAVSQAPADSEDRLPLTIRIGNAYSMLNERVILAADINSSQASGMGWNLGGEYWATRRVALRIGLENRGGDIAETTAGLGFAFGRLNLDTAFGLSELGMSQRISLAWKFGKSSMENRDKDMERLIKAGNAAFAKGNYAQAVAKLEAALSVDPSNKNLQAMIDKLHGIAGSIPAATGDGEVDQLLRRGVASYVQGDLNTAYDLLRTAYEKNPSNQRLMNFTNRVARLAGQPQVEPPRDSVSGARWTLIDQKLHDALQAIYEGRYDVSINKCEEVLRIDPSNVTAIGRMGAAFFLMGEKEKAIKLWKRALELEPNNQIAIEYLKQLGAE